MWIFICIIDTEFSEEYKTDLFYTKEEAISYCADYLAMDMYDCVNDLVKFNEAREKIYFELKNCHSSPLFSKTYFEYKFAMIENYNVQEIDLPYNNNYVLK